MKRSTAKLATWKKGNSFFTYELIFLISIIIGISAWDGVYIITQSAHACMFKNRIFQNSKNKKTALFLTISTCWHLVVTFIGSAEEVLTLENATYIEIIKEKMEILTYNLLQQQHTSGKIKDIVCWLGFKFFRNGDTIHFYIIEYN